MENKEMTPEEWEKKKAEIVTDFVSDELNRLDEAEADGVPFDETDGEGSAAVAFADSDMDEIIGRYPMAGEILAMLEKDDKEDGEGAAFEGCSFLLTDGVALPTEWDDDDDDEGDDD